jgi:DNA-directed RNA polymerase specialized sigma24 family protein
MNKAIDDILKQYPFIGDDIRREQGKLNEFISLQQEARDTLKGQALTDMPHMPDGNTSDPTADAVERVIDKYQDKIDEQVAKINELMDRQKWLDKAYASLTEDERRIVTLRYNERWAARKIMRRLGIMRRETFYKTLDSARDKVSKIMLT